MNNALVVTLKEFSNSIMIFLCLLAMVTLKVEETEVETEMKDKQIYIWNEIFKSLTIVFVLCN